MKFLFSFFRVLLALGLALLIQSNLNAQCPDIQVIELLDVPGFAQTDDLVVCGKSDTLAFLLFIEEPGNISGTQMTLDFEPGMRYAGFELTHYDATTSISVVNPDPDKPRFLLDGITEGVYVAYIGVESTCEADINGFDYEVDIEFNYVFEDTLGNFSVCKTEETPIRTYNSIIKTPVINFQSTANLTINSLGSERCTNVVISQDGISSFIEEFEFEVTNLDLTQQLRLNSVRANGINIPYTYDAANLSLLTTVPGSVFPGNTNNSPADTLFNTNERVTLQFCYQADDCPTGQSAYPISYRARYGCADAFCQEIQADRTISIAPTVRPDPIATSVLSQQPGVCGDPAIIDLTLTSAVADSATGMFTDLTVGFETCERPSLNITKVLLGTGANQTEISSDNFTWVNDDINIDFTALTSDPDGVGIGITDADGDGFFDDLPGGQILNISVELDYVCALPPDPTSIACSQVDCSFSQFYVEANRDCGTSFRVFPPITPFEIINGATFVSSNETQVSNSFFGIAFGATGTSGAKTQDVEMCYIYERENVTPCPDANTANRLQVLYSGSPGIVQDVQLVPGSISLNGVPVADSDAVWTSIDDANRVLNINAGVNDLGTQVCYNYTLQVDTTLCSPTIYMVGNHQVIEDCDTGSCTCTTVKACESILFSSNPNATGCDCDLEQGISQMYRLNTGYTDASCTTKVLPEDVPLADRNRYLPGDTIFYETFHVFKSEESVRRDLYQLHLRTFFRAPSNRFDENELTVDPSQSSILDFTIKKPGTTTRVPIELDQIPSCIDSGPESLAGTNIFFKNHPWEDSIESFYQPANDCINSGFDFYDNNFVSLFFYNQNDLQECRGVTAWEDNGNCIEDWFNQYDVQVGDTLFLTQHLQVIKNPIAAANGRPTVSQLRLLNWSFISVLDEFATNCSSTRGVCREDPIVETFCPSDVSASSLISFDDCGGVAEHTFVVDNPTPIGWFTDEYFPYFKIQDIEVPIFSPLMYCGNVQATSSGGKAIPLSVKDTSNFACIEYEGDLVCPVSTGTSGTITFNPQDDGYPGLGFGLGGTISDTLTLSYDLCMVCPGDLTGVSSFEMIYDYQHPYDPPSSACYRCNFNATTLANNELDSCLIYGNGANYYDIQDLDNLVIFEDNSSSDLFLQDNRSGFPALTASVSQSLISSASPGSSVENVTYEICAADEMDPSLAVHMGVLGSIVVPSSVQLVDILDGTGAPFPFATIGSTGQETTYSISLPDLDQGDCVEFTVASTLLFCPEAPLPPPEICATVTSGCMDPDLQALVAGDTESCNGTQRCHAYTFGEAGIQADFLTPGATQSYDLCEPIPVAVLIKNVKTATVTDFFLEWDIPANGASIVPGSFEISYPNSGDFSLPFTSIPDPTINGTNLQYLDDAIYSSHIDQFGLPGVNVMGDSNQFVIQFELFTDCDEFVSGTQTFFEAQSMDPCTSGFLTSGRVNSNGIIINGANPVDFAQILTTAKPSDAYCGAESTEFTLTGLNISEVASGDSVQICLTFPEELIYEPGSVSYNIPANQPLGIVTETMIGTQTQLCFDGVHNLPVGGQFTISYLGEMTEAADCEGIRIGVDIRDYVEDVICVTGANCDVWVQTSVNNDFGVNLNPPIEVLDLTLNSQCLNYGDSVTLCYEAMLFNPGPDYMGDITATLHDDITGNGDLDSFDAIIGSDSYPGQFIPSMDTIIITSCFTVDEPNACPVILNLDYETSCNCTARAYPFDEIEPQFLADLPPTSILCPGEEIAIEVCGDFTYTLNPPADGYMRTVGDSVFFGLNTVGSTVSITADGMIGECTSTNVVFMRELEVFPVEVEDNLTCVNISTFLQLVIPTEFSDGIDILWSPSTFLDDPTISNPIFNAGAAGNYGYEVTYDFGDGCLISDSVFIVVETTDEITLSGDTEFCNGFAPATLLTDTGFDTYEWFRLAGGLEIISAVTTTNTWTGPFQPGTYIVKGYSNGVLCPSVSNPWDVIQIDCIDIELDKTICNVPMNPGIGDTISFCIEVCNIGDPSMGLIYDADNIEVEDSWPPDVAFIDYTATSGTFIFNTPFSDWQIPFIASGACEEIEIRAEILNAGVIENVAQVTSYGGRQDADSGEDNDNGDQSEDEEDKASIEIILANIGDLLFIDADGDGIQDPGETGVAGATVTLFDAITGLPVAMVMTDANGNYLFTDIPSGDYTISFDLSTATTPGATDYLFTFPGTGNGSNDSEADQNGNTPPFTFDATMGDDLTHDAGVIPAADLGNFVWVDDNGDGVQDPSEQGIANVQVDLIDPITGTVLATVFTDPSGMYLFEDLPAGNYEIQFDFSTASGAQDYVFTMQNTGASNTDSNVDATGSTGIIMFDPLNGDDLTIDAGLVPVADIGNYVWIDTDMNGLQDATEMGVAGVTVLLKDFNTGLTIATVMTDSNGMYLFEDVPEGDYFIEFDPSTSSLSNNFSFTGTNNGNGTNDSDASAGGFTSLISFDPTMGDDLTIDAGLFPTADIGDTVWIDADGDGIIDPTEMGVAGAIVTLFDSITGAPIATAVTDANGNYLFEDIPSGDYFITYDTSTSTTPGVQNYIFTMTGGDSEADATGQGPAFMFDASLGDDLTHDAGILPSANIGNFVWVDSDGDGIQDPGEMGVANAQVTLFDAITGLPVATVFTDANGEYLFQDVPAGDYYIEFDLSGSGIGMLQFTQSNVGGNDANDSDADANGLTSTFTFDPTTGDDLTYDAGIILVEGIGNFVWIDSDGDGVQDPGEMGLEGVSVTLYDSNTGLPIATVLTDANGEYLFTNVPAGDYFIEFDISSNTSGVDYPFTQSGAGNNNTGSDADSNGFTMSFSFDPSNGPDLTWDAGLVPSANIGDTVWIDADGDGILDATEMGAAGVTVTLFDAITGAVIATTTTDANGNYLFEDIPSGDYSISYDLSTSTTPGVINYTFTQTGGDSEANANGQGPAFTFDATLGDDLDHDAGILPSADIGNFVWQDTDGDGIQDSGEPGVSNVLVTLFDNVTGLPIDMVFTDANGEYLFEDIPAGDYFIVFDVMGSGVGQSLFTTTDSGTNDGTDSDADASGQTMSFIFDPTMGDDLTIDAGIVPVNDIGNYVWIDTNGDGIQDPSEMGLEGVTVDLFDANTGALIATVLTDANGNYLFNDIPMGDYFINFDLSTNTSGVNYPFTGSGTGNGVNDSDADANGNTLPFSFDPNNGPDLTWDAGIIPSADIGDSVWIDANGDGIQDPSEVGVAGVTVTLFDAITGLPIAMVLTDANGNYLFEDIPSGDYFITYDTSTSTTPGASSYPFTQTGGDSESDPTGQGPSFTFDATMGDDLDHDAGILPVADIGDYVWIDTDGDGIQDANEMGLENVEVTLFDMLGNVVATVFTDVNGQYVFEDIPAGTYSIGFDTSTSNSGNYMFSPQGNGDGTNDSEADVNGQTTTFVFDPSTGDDLTHDAGVIPVADLGDTVFVDANGDGIQDPSEMGLAGVTVTLYDANTGLPISTTTTDANGNYLFSDLPAGDYFIGFDPSTSPGLAGGSEFSPTGNGNSATDSDAGINGNTSVINFDPTMGDDLTIDAGIIPTADIGDFVWIDTDGDGIQDLGEMGVAGVTVILYDANTGLPIATVMTDANGNYLFEDIPTGDYFIEFDATTSAFGPDFTFAAQNAGAAGDDSDADADGFSPTFSFDASMGDKLTCDAGLQPTPMISNVKYIVSNQILSNGVLEIVYGIGVQNTGLVNLTNLSLEDDLFSQIGPGFISVFGNTVLSNSTASSTPSLNTSFDGVLVIDLFNGSATDLLEPGQEIELEITVLVNPDQVIFPILNQTTSAGDGVDENGDVFEDGAGNALRVSDDSDSGRMHGDDNPGEPGDTGTSDDPTLIECFPANIIVTGDETFVCNGDDVVLNVTSDYTNVQYQWREVGNATIISTSTNPSFTPAMSTDYEVTLVVFDDVCVYDLIDTVNVVVLAPINISIVSSYTLNPDCSPSDLSFEVLLDGNPATFTDLEWTGPNGFSSTDPNPTITNATAAANGNYTVVIIDEDGCIGEANVEILDVVDPENNPVIVSSGPACQNEEIVLMINAYTGSNVTYTWTTPAGVTAGINGQETNILTINPLDSLTHTGLYTIDVNVDGCMLTADFEVNVLSSPTIAPSFTVVDACDQGTIELMANASGLDPLTYNWVGPNGFVSALENPIITNATVANNGQYIVSVTNGNGCIATASIDVGTILPELPSATISSNGPQVCEGDSIKLESSSVGVMFEWIGTSDSPGSLAQAGQTTTSGMTCFGPDHPAYGSGPWMVRVTDANGCTSESPAIEIEILPVPQSAANNNGPICFGNSATVSASTVDGGIYNWYDGPDPATANLVSTDQNYFISNLPVGMYTFYLQVELNTCLSPIYDTSFEVEDNPVVLLDFDYTMNSDCAGSPLSLLSDVSTSPVAVTSFSWTGPNGFTSNQANPIINNASTNNNGSYTLVVTSAAGCTASATIQVNTIVPALVNDPIITSTGPACDGGSITLTTAIQNGTSVNYVWSFPSSVNVTGQGTNQIVIFPLDETINLGNYSVNVVVDGCSATSEIFDVTSLSASLAAPTATISNICEGGNLFLMANSPLGTSFLWSGPNGFTSTQRNPVVTNVSEFSNGTYTLIVTNQEGCSSENDVLVSSILPPAEVPTIAVNGPNCQGDDIVFSTSTNGSMFEWIGPLGASSGTLAMPGLTTSGPTTTIDSNNASYLSGDWRVQVTDANGCTAISDVIGVGINDVPLAIIINNGDVCEGEPLKLSANTVAGSTYAWYDADPNAGGILISQDQSIEIFGLAPNSYTYFLQVDADGCPSEISQSTVVVNSPPIIDPDFVYMANADCSASDLSLSANDTGNGPFTYNWTGPNGFTSTNQNPVLIGAVSANNGSYTLQITDVNGCVSELMSLEVDGVEDSVPEPIIVSSGSVCNGETITLSVQDYVGTQVTYNWTTPNGFTGIVGQSSNTLIISPVDETIHAGMFSVEVIVDDCTVTSDAFLVEVFEDPTALISATTGAICQGETLELFSNAVNAVSYDWTGPNGFTSNAADITLPGVTDLDNGTYTVVVTTQSGCTATNTFVVDNITELPVTPTLVAEAITCDGSDLVLSTTAVGTLYEWISPLGDSPSNSGIPELTTTSGSTTIIPSSSVYLSGAWSVRVTDANGCTATSSALNLSINEIPQALIINEGDVCSGESILLSASNVAGANYFWYDADPSAGGVLISQDESIELSGLAPNTYTYFLQIEVAGCPSAVVQSTATVNELPVAGPTFMYMSNVDCSASDLNLTANESGNGPFTYSWTGPNGFTSTDQNPVLPGVASVNNGSYTLQITDANGCVSELMSLEVDGVEDSVAEPVIVSTGSVCNGETITLTVQDYVGTQVTYNWTTPNGFTGIIGQSSNTLIISPVDETLHEGSFSVEVIVDDCTVTSDAFLVEVFEDPTALISATTGAICQGETLELFSNAVNAVSYAWTGPNGFTSNAADITLPGVTDLDNGTYTVVVTSQSGCTATNSFVVDNITELPVTPTLVADVITCDGSDLVLSTTAIGTLYEWISPLGDSPSNSGIPELTTTSGSTTILPSSSVYLSGTWSVRVTDANGCTATSSAVNLSINEIPRALIINEGDVCSGESIMLSASNVAGADYFWYDADPTAGGVLISQDQSIELSGLAPNAYTYFLQIEVAGCPSAVVQSTATVNELPIAGPTFMYMSNVDCSASDLSLTANEFGNGPFTYSWTGPNGFTSTDQNPVLPGVASVNNGSYVVQITDANGCISELMSLEVDGVEDSVPEPVIVSTGSVCNGETITLSVQDYVGTQVTYTWTTPNGFTSIVGQSSNTLIISPVDETIHAGMFSVEVIVDDCTVTSDAFLVEVFEDPTALISATTGAICQGETLELFSNAVNAVSYAWTGPNGFTSNAADITLSGVTDLDNGTYTVVVTSQSGCTATNTLVVNNITELPVTPTLVANVITCDGSDLLLSTTAVGTLYEWISPLGDSPSNSGIPELTTTTGTTTIIPSSSVYLSGAWSVRVTDANGCTATSSAVNLSINEIPQALIINEGDVCSGESIVLSASNVAGANYFWYDADPSAGGVLISQDESIELSGLIPNAYTYFLQIEVDGCPSLVVQSTATVNELPVAGPIFMYMSNVDCSASDLSLIANESGNGPFTYSWTGPNGFTSTDQNPVLPGVASVNNGSYTVQITDSNGCVSELMALEVDGVEDAVAEPVIVSSGSACNGESITLSVQSFVGNQVTYNWTTPNGFTGIIGQSSNTIIISPVDETLHAGAFSVEVIVDDCTVTSDAFQVEVFESPTALISATTGAICQGETLELFSNATNAVSYAWTGPNGFTSSAVDVTLPGVTDLVNGTYTLTVTSQSGCTASNSFVVDNITELPTTPTLVVADICENESLVLSTSAVGTLFEWISPLGDSPNNASIPGLITNTGMTTISVTSTAYLSGDWTVRVTDANGCTSTSAVNSVVINDIPVALARNDGPICEDSGDIQLLGNEIPGATYEWYLGDPNTGGTLISTDMSPTLFAPAVDSVQYFLVVTQDGCSSIPSMTEVQVTSPPISDPLAIYNLNADCALTDLQLESNAIGAGPFEFLWTGPNNFVSTEQNPSILNITEEGNGSYSVRIIDANGCESTSTVELNNISDPQAQPVISTSGVSCDDGQIVLSTQAYIGTSVTYIWTTPNGTVQDISGLETNEITISPVDVDVHDGDYSLTVIVDDCTVNSATFNLEVLEEPVAAAPTAVNNGVCVGDDILLQSAVANEYLWSGPNGFSSTLQFPVISSPSLAAAGTYFLTVFNEQGCQSDPVSIDITVDVQPGQPTVVVNDNVICDTEDIVLQTSSVCDTYQWIGPGGSSTTTLNNPLLTTNANTTSIPNSDEAYSRGMWSVICINGNGCASEQSAALMVEIIEIEDPMPATDQFNACASEEVNLSAGEGYAPGTQFFWYDNDPASGTANLISNLQNPSLIEQITAGSFTYYLQIEQQGCLSQAVPVTVVVEEALQIAAANDGTECISSTTDVNLIGEVFNGTAPFSYNWSGPNNFVSVQANATLPNAVNGFSGTYILTITDANGCSAVTETTVDVTAIPNEPVLEYASSLCMGSEFVINAPLYEGQEVTYFWIGPNGSTMDGTYTDGPEIVIQSVDATHSGEYEVFVVVDGCTSNTSAIVPVFINELPSVAPTNDGVLCADIENDLNLEANVIGGQAPYTFFWQGPNNFTSQAENPQLSNLGIEASGTYTLFVMDANGCESAISSTTVSVSELPATPELTVSSEQLCENEQLLLTTQNYNSSDVIYTWILTDGSIVETDTPVLLINNANIAQHNGLISVMVTVNGCTSFQATPILVNIAEQPNAPTIANSTGANSPACEGNDILLSTPFIPDATYTWFGPNGFTSNLPSPSISNVSLADTGMYILIIDVDGCSSTQAQTQVFINESPDTPVAENDGPFCTNMDIRLFVPSPDPEVIYNWYRTSNNALVGTGPELIISSADVSDAGGYYVIAEDENECESIASNVTQVVVNTESAANAYAGEDDIVCEPNYTITGNELLDGSGFWTQVNPNGQTQIVDPSQAQTLVRNLEFGENIFVWTIGNGACTSQATDTLVIVYNDDPIVTDDIYTIEVNEQLDDSVLDNDFANAVDFSVSNFTDPANGTLTQNTDGTFTYIPNMNFVGVDSYSYELCHTFCPENCVEATVFITIGQEADCFAPTIITPNGDGVNDSFTIPCLANFENSHICIFNRWGDEVYRNEDYRNEWEGTFKDEGSSLPAGTYYYILQVNDGNNTVLSGYVFIQGD